MDKEILKINLIRANLVLFFSIIFLFIFYYLNSASAISENSNLFKQINSSDFRNIILEECRDKNLQDTIKCLINFTNNFYIYNFTDDNIDLTFEELKNRGGDCRDWAFYYQDLAKDLGYQATTSSFTLIPNLVSHRVAIISDIKKYCIIDQTVFKCVELE